MSKSTPKAAAVAHPRGGAGRGQGRKAEPMSGPAAEVMAGLSLNQTQMSNRLGLTQKQVSILARKGTAPSMTTARGALLTLAQGIEAEKRTPELRAWIEREVEFWRKAMGGVFL